MRNILIFLLLIGIAISCKEPQKKRVALLPNVTGNAGEIVLVVNNDLWDSQPGEEFRMILQKGVVALPQPEPLFDLINIAPGAFSNIIKTHRNIIIVEIAPDIKEPKLLMQKDVWAKPQVLLKFLASSEDKLMPLIKENESKIQSVFLDAERNRYLSYYKKYEEKDIRDKLMKKHQLGIIVPKGYKIDIDTGNFVWISHETPDLKQNIIIYTYPYTDKNTFTADYLINKRNEIAKKFIPGPKPETYMTTELRYEPEFLEVSYKNKYYAQMKGLWKVENYFMGGPFISLTTLDEERNKIVTVEGFVYAPRLDKRNYIRELETILYTLKFAE